jgi:hypothetical protein
MRRVSPPCSDIEDFDDADDGLLPSRGANSPHSARTTERDTHGHTDTFLVSSASTSRGFLHPALEAAELRLKTPPVHLAGMPPVKPRGTASDDPEAPPARPSSSRRARLLPTPIATPFTSPAVDHRVRQRPERTRTPSPTQQLHTLRGRSEVYPRVLAAAAAMRRPRSVDVASDRSPRVAVAEVAATPTPTVRKMTPSAAVSAVRVSKRNPNRYRPRDLPIADDPTVPPGIAGLQQTPEAQRRGARPLPSFDVCMCLSPENGERVNAAMLTPVHPARGAHPRPVPAFNGTDPTLESLLPAEVLHFAQRRVSRRKVFSRWRVRFLAHRLAAHMRNRRLRSVLVRWNGAAAQVRVAREQCQWHVARRCVGAWSQRLEARRELHRADALSLQFLKRRALRTWNGALRQRGDLLAAGRVADLFPVITAFRSWRRKASEAAQMRRRRQIIFFRRWRVMTVCRRVFGVQGTACGRLFAAWRHTTRRANLPAVRATEAMAARLHGALQRRFFEAWHDFSVAERQREELLQHNQLRLGRRRLRGVWLTWCAKFTHKRTVRRRALLMKLAA